LIGKAAWNGSHSRQALTNRLASLPTATRIAFGSDDSKDANIWIYELSGTTSMRQLTFGGRNRFPIWSANGQRVVFQSDREGDFGIFWQRADGTGTAERLTRAEPGASHVPESWSRTGDRLLFGVTKGRVMGLAAGERSSAFLQTFSLQDRKAIPFGEVRLSSTLPLPNAVFSPDARWVAYSSNEMGAGPPSVFVQPFPATGAKYLIGGGRNPIWSPDGRELFFWQGGFVVSSVSTHAGFAFGSPLPLATVLLGRPGPTCYDIAPDGRRFIGVVDAEGTQSRIYRGSEDSRRHQLVRGAEGACAGEMTSTSIRCHPLATLPLYGVWQWRQDEKGQVTRRQCGKMLAAGD
jgi:WD40-like Beta Propeller Repeat